MRPLRAFALMALLGWFGAWMTNGPVAPAPAPRPLAVTVPATTTTIAPTTTTTEAPHPPPSQPARASRGHAHRSPPAIAPAPPVASPETGDACGTWGYKTRARSDECWGPIIAGYGDWPTSTMLRILYCESKGNPWVVNSSNHVGLFQIKNSNTKGDGPGNIAHAHAMWQASGTAPWRQCGG